MSEYKASIRIDDCLVEVLREPHKIILQLTWVDEPDAPMANMTGTIKRIALDLHNASLFAMLLTLASRTHPEDYEILPV